MAITLSGGTTVGNAGHGATCKPYGFVRVQFDTAGTYVSGGTSGFEDFVQTITGLAKITVVEAIQVKPGGAFYHYWDQVNDKLMAYVATTGVEVAGGAACVNTNVEMLIIYE